MRKQTEPIVHGLDMVRGDVVPDVRREDETPDDSPRVPEDVREDHGADGSERRPVDPGRVG